MTHDLTAALQQHFGLTSFRHSQDVAIGHVLAGRDALVVMPTGAGKSLIYQLPALLLEGTTLVISPLIALMKDQVDQLAAAGKRATFINSTLAPAEQARRAEHLGQGAYAPLYAAPERLRSPGFARALARARITRVAVDEAHCISQWGHDFRPDYLHLRAAVEQLGRPPVTALTATATPQVQDDIAAQLGLREPVRLVTGFNRPNLIFEVQYARMTRTNAALARVDRRHTGQRDDLHRHAAAGRRNRRALAALGRAGAFYHAGLDGQARRQAQDAFMRGQLRAIVATNAFGMGVTNPTHAWWCTTARQARSRRITRRPAAAGATACPRAACCCTRRKTSTCKSGASPTMRRTCMACARCWRPSGAWPRRAASLREATHWCAPPASNWPRPPAFTTSSCGSA
jgi:ATP-dependent DNA helicase RecQ